MLLHHHAAHEEPASAEELPAIALTTTTAVASSSSSSSRVVLLLHRQSGGVTPAPLTAPVPPQITHGKRPSSMRDHVQSWHFKRRLVFTDDSDSDGEEEEPAKEA